jgi:FkbM family methyltransferase
MFDRRRVWYKASNAASQQSFSKTLYLVRDDAAPAIIRSEGTLWKAHRRRLAILCLLTCVSAAQLPRDAAVPPFGNRSVAMGRRLHAELSLQRQHVCPAPDHEPLLHSLVGGLLLEGLVPNGSAVDAGANSGEESCFYAELQPQRVVHAVEPVAANVQFIKKTWVARLPNLAVLHGGLGSKNRFVRSAEASRKSTGQGSQVKVGDMSQKAGVVLPDQPAGNDAAQLGPGVFRVYRLDDLYAREWRGERLGFAHFDVEGGELDLLRGAVATIQRDRPVFTVEVHVHNKPNLTADLLHLIQELGYSSFLVEEQCGVPVDCRNILNLPRETLNIFKGSPILDLATASGKLFAVNPQNVASQAYAEACRPGGICCPNGAGKGCCYHTCVQAWLGSLHGAKVAAKHAHVSFFGQRRRHKMLFPPH